MKENADIKAATKDTESLVIIGTGMNMNVKGIKNVHTFTKKLTSQEDIARRELGTEVMTVKEARVEEKVKKKEGGAEKGLTAKKEVTAGDMKDTKEADKKIPHTGDTNSLNRCR